MIVLVKRYKVNNVINKINKYKHNNTIIDYQLRKWMFRRYVI
jgi:ketopantoate reductase